MRYYFFPLLSVFLLGCQHRRPTAYQLPTAPNPIQVVAQSEANSLKSQFTANPSTEFRMTVSAVAMPPKNTFNSGYYDWTYAFTGHLANHLFDELKNSQNDMAISQAGTWRLEVLLAGEFNGQKGYFQEVELQRDGELGEDKHKVFLVVSPIDLFDEAEAEAQKVGRMIIYFVKTGKMLTASAK